MKKPIVADFNLAVRFVFTPVYIALWGAKAYHEFLRPAYDEAKYLAKKVTPKRGLK